MQLRFVEIEDLERVLELEEDGFAVDEQLEEAVLTFYVKELHDTCLVIEDEGVVCAHILASPSQTKGWSDSVFEQMEKPEGKLPYLAVASLSVAESYRKQGLGTLLLAGLKEIAANKEYEGISLTCHDYLIPYYEMNGFEEMGISDSRFAGKYWHDMFWKTLSNRGNLAFMFKVRYNKG